MSNKPPIEGYVDPSIPNPNREEDAPIIIYGYVIKPKTFHTSLLFFPSFRCNVVGYSYSTKNYTVPIEIQQQDP